MRKLVLVAAVLVVAGCGATKTVVRTVAAPPTASPGPAGLQRFYGQIRSLRRVGDHYELRFDPAFLVSGITANVAAAEAQGLHCKPSTCPAVPNDNYVVDEGHRTLTFLVPSSVRGTVLTRKGSGPFPATRITAAQFEQIVAGKSPLKLFEPLSSGMWILVHGDTVQGFAQQYVP
jgi:hypothetical protein